MTRPQVVPVAVTAGAGSSTQTCPKHKSLFDKGKVKLSTEKANPYYYHYVFIEVIDNNIPSRPCQTPAQRPRALRACFLLLL